VAEESRKEKEGETAPESLVEVENVPDEPVASSSIGQLLKATSEESRSQVGDPAPMPEPEPAAPPPAAAGGGLSSIGQMLKNAAAESRHKDEPAPPLEPVEPEAPPPMETAPEPEEFEDGFSGHDELEAPAVVGRRVLRFLVLMILVGSVVGAGIWYLLRSQSLGARYERGAALIEEGNDAEAQQLFNECYQEAPRVPELFLTYAEAYQKRGNYAKAEEMLRHVLDKLEYRNRRAMSMLAELGLESGDLAVAESGSTPLMKFYYDDVMGYLYQARIEMARGDYTAAVDRLRQAEWFSEDDPQIYRLLRRNYLMERDYDAARQANQVLERQGKEAETEEDFIDIVSFYLAVNNHYRASEYLRIGLAQFPEGYELLLFDVQVAYREQRYDYMVEAARKLIAKRPQDPQAYYYAGEAAYARGNLGDAIKWFKTSAAIDPQYAPSQERLGDIALLEFSNPAVALDYYEQASQFGVISAQLAFHRGVALYHLNRLYEVVEWWEKTLAMEPESKRVKYDLATAYLRLGDVNAAADLYQQCASIAEARGYIHNNLGVIAELHGDTRTALQYYLQAKEVDAEIGEISIPAATVNFARFFTDSPLVTAEQAMDTTIFTKELE